eukprot:scaffold13220_cov113-Isochrysis_galbana.AAC.3
MYGRATSISRSFMQHHSQRLSRAPVMADAAAICKKVGLKQHACLIPRLPPPPPAPPPSIHSLCPLPLRTYVALTA